MTANGVIVALHQSEVELKFVTLLKQRLIALSDRLAPQDMGGRVGPCSLALALMISAHLPASLPSLDQRRAVAGSLLDPSGKGLYNGFRVPDQAVVWVGSAGTVDPKGLVRLFREDSTLTSLFWLVPLGVLEPRLALLHQALGQANGVGEGKGFLGIWEALPGTEADTVLVAWVGPASSRSALEGALGAVGFEGDAAGPQRVVFESDTPSPLEGKALASGEELTDEQDDVLWGAMSSKTEGSLYAGSTYLVEWAPLLLLLVVAMVAAVWVCSQVGSGGGGVAQSLGASVCGFA